jgi:hypothetical protein
MCDPTIYCELSVKRVCAVPDVARDCEKDIFRAQFNQQSTKMILKTSIHPSSPSSLCDLYCTTVVTSRGGATAIAIIRYYCY